MNADEADISKMLLTLLKKLDQFIVIQFGNTLIPPFVETILFHEKYIMRGKKNIFSVLLKYTVDISIVNVACFKCCSNPRRICQKNMWFHA